MTGEELVVGTETPGRGTADKVARRIGREQPGATGTSRSSRPPDPARRQHPGAFGGIVFRTAIAPKSLDTTRGYQKEQYMRNILGLTLAATLAAVPLSLEAQQPQPRPLPQAEAPRPHGPADRPALGFLLQHRAELGLTDNQIGTLQQIAQRLEQQNEPLLQQLRDAGIPVRRERRDGVREMTPEQRRELRQRMETHRPTLMQLRQNTNTAMQQARDVLTAEQQERMREIMRQRSTEIREQRQGARDGTGPRGQGPRAPRGT
jgi:hypothetical protein